MSYSNFLFDTHKDDALTLEILTFLFDTKLNFHFQFDTSTNSDSYLT